MKYILKLLLLFSLAGSFALAQNGCVVGHWEYSMGMDVSPMEINNLLQDSDTRLSYVATDGIWWLDIRKSDRGPAEYDAVYSFDNFSVSYIMRSATFAGMGDIGLDIMVSGEQPFALTADEHVQIIIPDENTLLVKAAMSLLPQEMVLDHLPRGFLAADTIDCGGNLLTLRGESPVLDDAGNTIMSAITFVRSE